MTPSAPKIHAAIAIMATFVAACAPTRPTGDDLGIAARNLAAARAAGAETYAPLELRAAEDHLAQANAASAQQDYDRMTMLAAESAVDSELAAAKSRLGKAREAVESLKQQNADLSRDAARHAEGASLE
jgi:hypothetical protein